MQLINSIGILGSIFTAASLLPQLIKIIKNKKAEDVFFIMLAMLFIGVSLWIFYGTLKKGFNHYYFQCHFFITEYCHLYFYL